MTRWRSTLRLEVTTVVRERFAHAAAVSGLLWLTMLLPMPPDLRRIVAPYVLLGDITIVGFYFIGGAVFFEKQQRTLDAVICSPLRFWEYLSAKVAVLMALSLLVAVVVVAAVHGNDVHLLQLVLGVVLGTLVMLLAGFITSLPFGSVSDWFLFATVPLAVAELPVLYLSGVWPNPVLYLLPTHGPLLLLGAAFDQIQLAPWQIVYAVCYPLACAVGLYGLSVRFFDRYVIQRPEPTAMTTPSTLRVWAALARNDLRGTYRDPLLVGLVMAPVIWTTGTALVVPRLTRTVALRYNFDLVPYYPLAITALLLLTSIIVSGGLAAFLVLDEMDAGTLTALRATPVSLSTFLGYRAATVVLVTTIYVMATMHFSGLLSPGLLPALIPIAMVAGLSAVVTLLLIVAVASNKIQGIAMVRLLGIIIAGMPCIGWFVDSAWNLAFGVLPPYWAAKAFWVADSHGTWWPYLLGGVIYNLALIWLLMRRFVARNTA